jgi:hypothetical protein
MATQLCQKCKHRTLKTLLSKNFDLRLYSIRIE